jgi:hypothetical protein
MDVVAVNLVHESGETEVFNVSACALLNHRPNQHGSDCHHNPENDVFYRRIHGASSSGPFRGSGALTIDKLLDASHCPNEPG